MSRLEFCACVSPIIRCDNRGCLCTRCGRPEGRIIPTRTLQTVAESTCEAIAATASARRARLKAKIAEFLQTRDESIFTGTDLDTDEQERADSADEILNLIDEELA